MAEVSHLNLHTLTEIIISNDVIEGQAVFPPDLHQVPVASGYLIVKDD